jgi:hypothetical protein
MGPLALSIGGAFRLLGARLLRKSGPPAETLLLRYLRRRKVDRRSIDKILGVHNRSEAQPPGPSARALVIVTRRPRTFIRFQRPMSLRPLDNDCTP